MKFCYRRRFTTLWGKDLYQYFHNLYSQRALYCIVILSKAYIDKLWTRHELQAAQERVFKEKSDYILPIRLDDTPIPGIPVTIGYLDARDLDISYIAELVLEKVRSYIKIHPNSVYAPERHGGKYQTTTISFSDDDYKPTLVPNKCEGFNGRGSHKKNKKNCYSTF